MSSIQMRVAAVLSLHELDKFALKDEELEMRTMQAIINDDGFIGIPDDML